MNPKQNKRLLASTLVVSGLLLLVNLQHRFVDGSAKPSSIGRSIEHGKYDLTTTLAGVASRSQKAKLQRNTKKFFLKSHVLLRQTKVNEIISKKLEFEEYLKLNPNNIKKVKRELRSSKGSQRAKLAMVSALASIDHPLAQQTLLSIAESSGYSEQIRLQSVVSISELSTPSQNVIKALWNMTDRGYSDETKSSTNLSNASLLALGNIASEVQNHDTATSAQIVAELLERLALAEQRGNKNVIDYLDALGNSGDPKVIEVADKYILSPLPSERAMGASLLRVTKESGANQRLLELLNLDESNLVRREAVNVLAIRSLDSQTIQELSLSLLEEPDAAVRSAIIDVLRKQDTEQDIIKESFQELLLKEDNQNNFNKLTEDFNA